MFFLLLKRDPTACEEMLGTVTSYFAELRPLAMFGSPLEVRTMLLLRLLLLLLLLTSLPPPPDRPGLFIGRGRCEGERGAGRPGRLPHPGT